MATMSPNNYNTQKVYRYIRTSCMNACNEHDNEHDDWNSPVRENIVDNELIEEASNFRNPCPNHRDSEGEISNILHKKCAVICLAQQQIQRLLDDTDTLLYENTRSCRSVVEFLNMCKEIIACNNNKVVTSILMTFMFVTGILLGAASCGTTLGRFNSILLNCIDNRFIPDVYTSPEEVFRSIV